MYAPLLNVVSPKTDQYPVFSGMVDSAHGEIPPPVVGGNNLCEYHLYMAEMYQIVQGKKESHIESHSMQLLQVQSPSRLPQMLLVKLIQNILLIPAIPHRFPASMWQTITCPLYMIMELPVNSLRVRNTKYFRSVRVVNNPHPRSRLYLGNCRRGIMVEETVIEDIVFLDNMQMG